LGGGLGAMPLGNNILSKSTMKILILFFSFLILLLTDVNCQIYHQLVSRNPDSKFNAVIDNENWIGECYLCFLDDKEIIYFYPNDKYHHLAIYLNFDGVGEYAIKDSTAALVKAGAIDILMGIYYSNGNPENKIVITKYDEKNEFVEGYFQFSYNYISKEVNCKSNYFKAYFYRNK
jgi:hypothetical protein